MSERQARLKRLVDLRAKELERRVKELSQARNEQIQAENRVVHARAERLGAVAARDERARAGLPAADWGQAESWLSGLAQKELFSEHQQKLAAREVEGARGRVAQALAEQEKVQLLIGRLAVELRKEETRAERKDEDEHASARRGANGARRGA